MRKAGLITLAILSTALFTSCGSSKSAGNGYYGVTSAKANSQRQKEFKKSKHKLNTGTTSKTRN